MHIDLKNPFVKVALPLSAIVIVLLLARYKYKMSLREDLAVRPPQFTKVMLWLSIALVWMLGTDYFMNWRESFDFTKWIQQPLYISILRVLAVCFLGPIAEELVFRGIFHYRVSRWLKGNQWVTVVILAAVWSAIHVDYSLAVIAVIFIEGIILGASRVHTKSIITPIILHICWNLYAVW